MEKRVTIRSGVINPGSGTNSWNGNLTSSLILSNKEHYLTKIVLNSVLLADVSGNVLQLERFSLNYSTVPLVSRRQNVDGTLVSPAFYPNFPQVDLYLREAGIRDYVENRLMPANAVYTINAIARFFTLANATDSLQFEIEIRFIEADLIDAVTI